MLCTKRKGYANKVNLPLLPAPKKLPNNPLWCRNMYLPIQNFINLRPWWILHVPFSQKNHHKLKDCMLNAWLWYKNFNILFCISLPVIYIVLQSNFSKWITYHLLYQFLLGSTGWVRSLRDTVLLRIMKPPAILNFWGKGWIFNKLLDEIWLGGYS